MVEGRRGGPLTDAAGEYDRAARELWGRIPPPSQAGQGLRAAAVALSAARAIGRPEHRQLLALLAQLGALADAVTRLRENQHRATQAAAARYAAEQLHGLGPPQRPSLGIAPGRQLVVTATQARAAADAATADEHRARGGPVPPPSANRGLRR